MTILPVPGMTCCGLRLTLYGTEPSPAVSDCGVIESEVSVPATKVLCATAVSWSSSRSALVSF